MALPLEAAWSSSAYCALHHSLSGSSSVFLLQNCFPLLQYSLITWYIFIIKFHLIYSTPLQRHYQFFFVIISLFPKGVWGSNIYCRHKNVNAQIKEQISSQDLSFTPKISVSRKGVRTREVTPIYPHICFHWIYSFMSKYLLSTSVVSDTMLYTLVEKTEMELWQIICFSMIKTHMLFSSCNFDTFSL